MRRGCQAWHVNVSDDDGDDDYDDDDDDDDCDDDDEMLFWSLNVQLFLR